MNRFGRPPFGGPRFPAALPYGAARAIAPMTPAIGARAPVPSQISGPAPYPTPALEALPQTIDGSIPIGRDRAGGGPAGGLPGGPPAAPITIVERVPPKNKNNTSEIFTLVGTPETTMASRTFQEPRVCQVAMSVQALDGAREEHVLIFGGTLQIWCLGRVSWGVGGVRHTRTFDLPLGSLIAFPIVAEDLDITFRLINEQGSESGAAVNTNVAFSNPGPLVGGFGAAALLNSALQVIGMISEEARAPFGQQEPPTRSWWIRPVGAAPQTLTAPIADGAVSVSVFGDTNAGANSWGFQCKTEPGGVTSIVNGLPLNAPPILIPPSAVAIQFNWTGPAQPGVGNFEMFEVAEYMGF